MPTLPDGSDLDAAIVNLLANDATLKPLLVDGVFIDIAPPGAKQFAIVSVLVPADVDTFQGRALEDVLYVVKAVEASTVATKQIKAAAYRIDQLLARALFTVTGYGCVTMEREQRVRNTEVDEADKSIRWQHRGGQYRALATVGA
jgi:hypothetical protein